MKTILPVLLITLVLASSCEKSITINLPEEPRKLVLNAIVLRGSPVHAYLTRTLSNAESGKSLNASVAGARMLLYRDGQLVDTLDAASPGQFISDVATEAGHRYKLVISHPSYATVEAEAVAPERVPILGWDVTRNARSNPNNGDQDLLRLRFRDPAATGNHYVMQILGGADYMYQSQPLDFYSWGDCISISDPSFESPYASEFPGEEACLPARSLLLRDPLFNGQEKELKLYGSSYTLQPYIYSVSDTGFRPDTAYARILMYHVSEDFYRFIKSYRSAWDASGNPFAEPFNVTTNVRGGHGVFAILSEEEFEVR